MHTNCCKKLIKLQIFGSNFELSKNPELDKFRNITENMFNNNFLRKYLYKKKSVGFFDNCQENVSIMKVNVDGVMGVELWIVTHNI